MVAWTRHGLKPLATKPEMFLHLNTSMGRGGKIAVYHDNANPTKGDVDFILNGAGKTSTHKKAPQVLQHPRGASP